MKECTEKQLAYATLRAEGTNKRQAAIGAGYSPAGAGAQADTLEKLPHVKAAIARIKREKRKGNVSTDEQIKSIMGVPAGKGGRRPNDEPRMKAKYDSPLDVLMHTYNNPLMPDSLRLRAAEQALPYMHARIGEKGKKEQAADRAKEVAGQGKTAAKAGKKSPFAPKAPPSLKVVAGGKS